MGREDQVEEREVLESIFPEEITGKLDMKELCLDITTDWTKTSPRQNSE